MPSKQYTVGISPDGPTVGQSIFRAEFLGECFVNFIIVNNANENQLNPDPDFSHNYLEKTITRTNTYLVNDKLIIDYTPSCSNCNCK